MTRQFLRTICRALIGVLLLAQLAVAAYACPQGVRSEAMATATAMQMQMQMASSSASDSATAMSCDGMAGPADPHFANLCAEHCHPDQQSDQAATLTVPAALLTALYATVPAPLHSVPPGHAMTAATARVAAAPPHTILHCCFRI